jgi:hypothetical protein
MIQSLLVSLGLAYPAPTEFVTMPSYGETACPTLEIRNNVTNTTDRCRILKNMTVGIYEKAMVDGKGFLCVRPLDASGSCEWIRTPIKP